MANLLKRIKSHTTGQVTSGQNTLSLFVETVDHGIEHNDFTPLVALVSLSQPAQSRMVRSLTGKVLMGYELKKSDKADYGMVLRKVKTANQGLNEAQMRKVRDMVGEKKSIQSGDVKAFLTPVSEKKGFTARDLDALTKSAKTWTEKHSPAEVVEKIKELQGMVAAFQKVQNDSFKGAPDA